MEASRPTNATSFVDREKLSESVQASRSKHPKAPQVDAPTEATLVEEAPAVQENPQEAERVKLLLDRKSQIEKHIGIQVSVDSLQDYIFKGRLIQSGVVIVPGKLTATFQTLSPQELQDLDARVFKIRNEMKYTGEGVDMERTLIMLSHVWQSLKWKDQPSKPLGDSPEKREKALRTMAPHVIKLAADSWNGLDFLIQYALSEDELTSKKS